MAAEQHHLYGSISPACISECGPDILSVLCEVTTSVTAFAIFSPVGAIDAMGVNCLTSILLRPAILSRNAVCLVRPLRDATRAHVTLDQIDSRQLADCVQGLVVAIIATKFPMTQSANLLAVSLGQHLGIHDWIMRIVPDWLQAYHEKLARGS
jgi:hypothetical protein